MAIKMTQYLMPNGHQTPVEIARPPEIEQLANELIAAGYRFEAELLMTGVVSFEVVGPEDEEGDPTSLAMGLVPNGPGVPEAVDALVREAHQAWKEMAAG